MAVALLLILMSQLSTFPNEDRELSQHHDHEPSQWIESLRISTVTTIRLYGRKEQATEGSGTGKGDVQKASRGSVLTIYRIWVTIFIDPSRRGFQARSGFSAAAIESWECCWRSETEGDVFLSNTQSLKFGCSFWLMINWRLQLMMQ